MPPQDSTERHHDRGRVDGLHQSDASAEIPHKQHAAGSFIGLMRKDRPVAERQRARWGSLRNYTASGIRMTEEEWEECKDPIKMLQFLDLRLDSRLRRFAVECCR